MKIHQTRMIIFIVRDFLFIKMGEVLLNGYITIKITVIHNANPNNIPMPALLAAF